MNKLRLNGLTSLIFQFITLLSGLIIPKLLLTAYGTQVNGLNYSITQMLSVISYFDLGVAAVAQATLYKPLYQKDYYQVSMIFNSVKRYFSRLTIGLLVYILLLCIYYGLTKAEQFSWIYTSTLILAISVSLIGQYVLGVSNQVILAADQKLYIYTGMNILTVLINIMATYLLVNFGQSIQVVKLVSSVIFLLRPICLQFYVKKHYRLLNVSEVGYQSIPNQWSGLIQHVAITLTSSLDTIILTLMSTLGNVSIYNIYTFPLNGIRLLIESLCSGYKSHFGILLAKGEKENVSLQEEFLRFEWLVNLIAVVSACVMLAVLVPFVLVYTAGIKDENYRHYLFSLIMITAYFLMSIKIPYTTVINSAGHFRETQSHSLVEIAINILLSTIFVKQYGLIGVAIGTTVSMLYRMLASLIYLRANILKRPIKENFRVFLVDALTLSLFVWLMSFVKVSLSDYLTVITFALLSTLASTLLFLVISGIFYCQVLIDILRNIRKK